MISLNDVLLKLSIKNFHGLLSMTLLYLAVYIK